MLVFWHSERDRSHVCEDSISTWLFLYAKIRRERDWWIPAQIFHTGFEYAFLNQRVSVGSKIVSLATFWVQKFRHFLFEFSNCFISTCFWISGPGFEQSAKNLYQKPKLGFQDIPVQYTKLLVSSDSTELAKLACFWHVISKKKVLRGRNF